MLKAWNEMSIALYVKGRQLANNCKKRLESFAGDERGLSGVVVAVLLVLIAILLIGMLWGFLSGWLNEVWGDLSDIDLPST